MDHKVFKHGDAHKLDSPDRLAWLHPSEVIGCLDLAPDMVVADVGAGTGYFALPVAEAVGPGGRVLAVDLQPEMLEKLGAKLGGVTNVDLRQGTAAATNLADACADRVLLANVWHEIDDLDAALREAARVLRPTGLLVIVDWRHDVEPMPGGERPPGPPVHHRVPLEAAAAKVEQGGFRVSERRAIGMYSYVVVGRRA